MWFLLKNIKLSSIFYTYILILHFILIIISNCITTFPSPAVGSIIPSLESESLFTDIPNQVGNYIEKNSESPQKIPTTINTTPQLATLNYDNFPLDSTPPKAPLLMSPTNEINNQNEITTNGDLEDDKNEELLINKGLFDDDESTTGLFKPGQMNKITGTNDQDLPEKIETINLDNDEEDLFKNMESGLLNNDNPTTGSLKSDKINKISDQDLTEKIETINLDDDEQDLFKNMESGLFDNDNPTTGSLKSDKINKISDQDLTEKIETINLDDDEQDLFKHTESGLFNDDKPISGSLKSDQMSGISDQDLTEIIETTNLDNDEENPFKHMESGLFNDDKPISGSLKSDQMSGISDQDLTEIIETTNLDNDEENPFKHMESGLFNDDKSISGSLKSDQMSGISDQDLTEKIETINLDDDEENPFKHMESGLFNDDKPISGSLESDKMSGISDQGDDEYNDIDDIEEPIKNIELKEENQSDLLKTDKKIDNEDILDDSDLIENAKLIEKLSQDSTVEQNLLEKDMLDVSDNQLIEPTSISGQKTQLTAGETITDNQGLKPDSIAENVIQSESNQLENLITGQKLLQNEAIDSIINNVPLTESTGLNSKLKNTNTNTSTTSNITKKKKKVPYKLEYNGEARVFCTFGTRIQKMYHKVKTYFIKGDLCHAIVYGVPLIIEKNLISMSKDDQQELASVHTFKSIKLLVVIMQHSSYQAWSVALRNPKKEVNLIMGFLKKYRIGGIQFSNLEPSPGDQLDTDMMCKLIIFFEMLTKATEAINRELKIGISISPYAQTVSTGFQSFNVLNDLVNWYSLRTISMVQCTPAYMKGTSPLNGTISLTTSFLELMKTDIRKDKVIISIQLYANKFGSPVSYSYVEMCLLAPGSWDNWCAARPEDFRLKGQFLRDLEIWGVQLYYMESDDYKAVCDCYKFPMIRALLRGMSNREQPKGECDYLGEVKNKQSKCSYENLLPDIDARVERQYKQAMKNSKPGGTST